MSSVSGLRALQGMLEKCLMWDKGEAGDSFPPRNPWEECRGDWHPRISLHRIWGGFLLLPWSDDAAWRPILLVGMSATGSWSKDSQRSDGPCLELWGMIWLSLSEAHGLNFFSVFFKHMDKVNTFLTCLPGNVPKYFVNLIFNFFKTGVTVSQAGPELKRDHPACLSSAGIHSFIWFFSKTARCTAPAGLELLILLPCDLKSWSYGHASSHRALNTSFQWRSHTPFRESLCVNSSWLHDVGLSGEWKHWAL